MGRIRRPVATTHFQRGRSPKRLKSARKEIVFDRDINCFGGCTNPRKLAAKDLDTLYAQHVHSIGMRLAAYCFSQFPTLDNLTLSGFSQRVDKSTGHENNDYLYSVRIPRQPWELLNFAATQAIDAYACLGEFEIRRNVLASCKMKAIEPFKN